MKSVSYVKKDGKTLKIILGGDMKTQLLNPKHLIKLCRYMEDKRSGEIIFNISPQKALKI